MGIRRIQLDRAEWARATEGLRRMLFFWKPKKRSAQAEESLGALLARRDQVRSKTTAHTPAEPRPDLFQPANAPKTVPDDFGAPAGSTPSSTAKPDAAQPPKESSPAAETTSRLLEAKRRAQRKK